MFKSVSLRQRLTLLSTALVGITLTIIGVVLYFYIEQSSYALLDAELREYTVQVENRLKSAATQPIPT